MLTVEKLHFREYLRQGEKYAAVEYYLRFPHIETNLAMRLKYSVYHAQLCRFAHRVKALHGFIEAAVRLFRSMLLHGYQFRRLWSRLYAFRAKVFHITSIPTCRDLCLIPRRQIWCCDVARILDEVLKYTKSKVVGDVSKHSSGVNIK